MFSGKTGMSKQVELAEKYSRIGYFFAMSVTVLMSILFSVYGAQVLSYFVAKEETVKTIFFDLAPILVFILLQASAALMLGIIKGLGLQY